MVLVDATINYGDGAPLTISDNPGFLRGDDQIK